MNKAEKFARCAVLAKGIVERYRAEAPVGCDPQNTYVAIAGTVISVGVGAYSASQQADAAGNVQVGEKPKAALYDPVDYTALQQQTIAGDQTNLSDIGRLVRSSNRVLTDADLNRIKRIIPGFMSMFATQGNNTSSLLHGNLPYSDVLGIASNSGALANSLGTPGTAGPATLRDLGVSRLQAEQQGSGMLSSMIGEAEQISPISRYTKPSDFMLTPSQTIPWEIEQRQLEQQSQQSANNLAAGVSPTQLAQQAAAASGASNPTAGYGQAIGQIAGMFGQFGSGTGGSPTSFGAAPGAGNFSPGTTGGYASDLAAFGAAPGAPSYSYNPSIGYSPMASGVYPGMSGYIPAN